MHETGIVPNLVRRIDAIIREYEVEDVLSIKIAVGMLSGISPGHLRTHLEQGLAGTRAARAHLDITRVTDPLSPWVTGVWLEGVEAVAPDGAPAPKLAVPV